VLTVQRFLIVAYHTSLQVFSVADSLLVRRIALPLIGANNGAPYLVAAALSQVTPELVWCASSDGRIWRVNWRTGSGADECLRTGAGVIHDMTLGAVTINKKLTDILYVSESLKNNYRIVAYDPSDLANPKSKSLQNQTGKWSILRTTNGGSILTAATGNSLMVGALQPKPVGSIEGLSYEFYSINASDEVSCLSVRLAPKKSVSKKKASQELSDQVLDVAVGGVRGAIYIYSDLLSQLTGAAKSRKGLETPKRQHWHQRAVHSVAWSLDGKSSELALCVGILLLTPPR
jgi:NET1-associated nuclear protein 1 (U3 small nucleolar RNA-associated protein 17)